MSTRLDDIKSLDAIDDDIEHILNENDKRIKVYARFRPVTLKERQEEKIQNLENSEITLLDDKKTCNIPEPKKKKRKGRSTNDTNSNITKSNNYTFDDVLWIGSSQLDVFNKCGKVLVNNTLDGYNCTVFSYGQTGSGKTYTMFGPENKYNKVTELGLIPRCIDYLFNKLNEKVNNDKLLEYKIYISCIEIYKEQLRDLISTKKSQQRLSIYIATENVIIKNLIERECKDMNTVLKYLIMAQTKREIKITEFMDHKSSRGHVIVQVNLKQVLSDGSVKSSRFNFCDLAGSELAGKNIKITKEAGKIHHGLLSLQNVIQALSDKKKHVPYTDSKLTKLLKDSIGGNSKTSVIINMSPHILNRTETLRTLKFGERTKQIKNEPKVNKKKNLKQLEQTIKSLKVKLKTVSNEDLINDMKIEITQKNKKISALKQLIKKKKVEIETLKDIIKINGLETGTNYNKTDDNNKSSKNKSKINNNDDVVTDDEVNMVIETETINENIQNVAQTFTVFMKKMQKTIDKVYAKQIEHDKKFAKMTKKISTLESQMENNAEIIHFKGDSRDGTLTDLNQMNNIIHENNDNNNDNDRSDSNTFNIDGRDQARNSNDSPPSDDDELSVKSVGIKGDEFVFETERNDYDNDNITNKTDGSTIGSTNKQQRIDTLIDEMKSYLAESRDLLKDAKRDDNREDSKTVGPNDNNVADPSPNPYTSTYSVGAKIDVLDINYKWLNGTIIDIDPFDKKSFKIKYDGFSDKWNEFIPFKKAYRISQYGTKCIDTNGTHVLLSTKYGQSKYAKDLRIRFGNNNNNDNNDININQDGSTDNSLNNSSLYNISKQVNDDDYNYSLMQGHIYKRNKWKTSKWSKCWFVLRKDLHLYYYNNKNDKIKKYRGVFELKNIYDFGIYDKKQGKTDYAFYFKTGTSKYYFCCENENDLIDWLSVIDYLINSDLDWNNTNNEKKLESSIIHKMSNDNNDDNNNNGIINKLHLTSPKSFKKSKKKALEWAKKRYNPNKSKN